MRKVSAGRMRGAREEICQEYAWHQESAFNMERKEYSYPIYSVASLQNNVFASQRAVDSIGRERRLWVCKGAAIRVVSETKSGSGVAIDSRLDRVLALK